MTTNDSEATPVRGPMHDALSVFLGEWRAEGISFGGTDQSGADPKANGVRGLVSIPHAGTPAIFS